MKPPLLRSVCALLIFALASAAVAALPEAPAWSLRTPTGDTVNFPADAQGQPTVLLFWPSWCPFSRALQPYVDDIWKDYRATGVKVWTINIKEDKDPVQVMKERGLSFPLLIKGDEMARSYRLQYTPWLVVIDGRNNQIVYTRPPKPPTPIDTAREVRAKLNELLGAKALPLPASYPKPYDLHLKDPATLNQKLTPVEIPHSVWGPWVTNYAAGIRADEIASDIPARGAIENGKAAITQAREIWNQRFGQDETLGQAPYRAYRKNNFWLVLGDGLNPALGQGFILVIEADSGRVIRVVEGTGD